MYCWSHDQNFIQVEEAGDDKIELGVGLWSVTGRAWGASDAPTQEPLSTTPADHLFSVSLPHPTTDPLVALRRASFKDGLEDHR